ncbi:MAG TPA: helix-turn-helix transcriptional regulator [Bryobacteraceae bacterium]|nr:helix-turn-helix transcriptional regulator [Bryobacteraceae bacterium]
MAKSRTKAAYMISAVAEQYEIHPQTLRLYEREGLLAPSRSEGNTRLYTDDDLERLEVILKLTRELGVNLAGVEIILNMREKMAAMQQQIEEFVSTLNQELATRARTPAADATKRSLIPVIQMNAIISRPAEGTPRPKDPKDSPRDSKRVKERRA